MGFVVLSAGVEKEIEGFFQMFCQASDGEKEYECVKGGFKKSIGKDMQKVMLRPTGGGCQMPG